MNLWAWGDGDAGGGRWKHQGPAYLSAQGVKEGGRLEAQAWGWAQNSCSLSLPQVSNSSRKSWAPELLLVATLLSPPSVFRLPLSHL